MSVAKGPSHVSLRLAEAFKDSNCSISGKEKGPMMERKSLVMEKAFNLEP